VATGGPVAPPPSGRQLWPICLDYRAVVEKGKGHDSRGARSLATCFPMLWLADQSGQAVRLYYYQQLFVCGNEPRLLVFFSKKRKDYYSWREE